MIGTHQLMIGMVSGCLLVVLGVAPGLFQGLAEGVRNLIAALSSPFAPFPQRHSEIHQPTWLTGLGAAIIVMTLLAYLS